MSTARTRKVPLTEFRLGMSRLASGVSVVATGSADDPAGWRGMTATAVCSLCAEPPSVLVCLNQETGTYRELQNSSLFSINVLSDHDVRLAQTFAGQRDLFGSERFVPEDWSPGKLGVPVLRSALTSLECRVSRSLAYGTHSVLIGDIESVRWTEENERNEGDTEGPLIYYRQSFRDLGTEIGVAGGASA